MQSSFKVSFLIRSHERKNRNFKSSHWIVFSYTIKNVHVIYFKPVLTMWILKWILIQCKWINKHINKSCLIRTSIAVSMFRFSQHCHDLLSQNYAPVCNYFCKSSHQWKMIFFWSQWLLSEILKEKIKKKKKTFSEYFLTSVFFENY